jgi:two-component system chemotaxis response regulator CheB
MPDQNKIETLVVDDSAVMRGLLTRVVESDPEIKVVSSAQNGEIAISKAKRHQPHVVVLDVEMPVMDGITALPKILEVCPHAHVIVASTLTTKNAKVSLRALEAGATEYLAKPSTGRQFGGAAEFKRDLIAKVKTLGRQAQSARPKIKDTPPRTTLPPAEKKPDRPIGDMPTRPDPKISPKVIAIGSSTGGPNALRQMFENMDPAKHWPPILITQHMPATFTTILANNLAQHTGFTVVEGTDGAMIQPNHVYIAPGDHHMKIRACDDESGAVIKITDDPPVNYCRPSVDPMLDSICSVYGRSVFGVILTGMGHDGRDSAKKLVEAGGILIAQDRNSSVVWGMPGAVAEAGYCTKILPIDDIGPYITQYIHGSKGAR